MLLKIEILNFEYLIYIIIIMKKEKGAESPSTTSKQSRVLHTYFVQTIRPYISS